MRKSATTWVPILGKKLVGETGHAVGVAWVSTNERCSQRGNRHAVRLSQKAREAARGTRHHGTVKKTHEQMIDQAATSPRRSLPGNHYHEAATASTGRRRREFPHPTIALSSCAQSRCRASSCARHVAMSRRAERRLASHLLALRSLAFCHFQRGQPSSGQSQLPND